ncbi:MAG: YhjD/YihY/BrkB family envelope integrity protein, partial [Burkholderiaceae bacterium]
MPPLIGLFLRNHPGWTRSARAVGKRIVDDQIPGRAAQMAFYFFLSVFPMLLILMASLDLFLDAKWLVRDVVLDRLQRIAPDPIVQLFNRVIDHLAGRSGA